MMRPGWQTTEFWLTLGKFILAVLTTTGIIHPGDADTLAGQITNAATAVAALLASGHAIASYSPSRGGVKQAQSYADTHTTKKG